MSTEPSPRTPLRFRRPSRRSMWFAATAVVAVTASALTWGPLNSSDSPGAAEPSEQLSSDSVSRPASGESETGERPQVTGTADFVEGDERPDADDPVSLVPEPVSVSGRAVQGPQAPVPAPAAGVELAAVGPSAPLASPAPSIGAVPPVLDVLAGAGPVDGLVSNAPGCSLRCISTATVGFQPQTTTIHFAVTTSVRARFQLHLSTKMPTMGPGGPVIQGVDPISNGRLTMAWDRTISGLAAGTTHYLLLKATDANGATQTAVTSFQTVWPKGQADDLAPAPSCAFQCVRSGLVRPGPTFDTMLMDVRTTVPATLQVAVSTSAPGSIGSTPVLNSEVPVFVPTGPASSWNLTIAPLKADTTYHALITATDAQGRSTRRVGSFRTSAAPPVPYRAIIHRVRVAYDGDPGDANRGELQFAWGVISDTIVEMGSRPEQKMRDGDGFEPAPYHTLVGSVATGGRIPSIRLTVVDDDNDGLPETCTGSQGLIVGAYYSDGCDERTAGGETGALTVADVTSLPTCAAYGFIGPYEDARCKLVDTGDHGEDYARAWTLVSYDLN